MKPVTPLVLFPLLALAAPLGSQMRAPFPVQSPAAAGFSATRLARIDSMVNGAVEKGSIPGAVVFIARNGRVVVHKAYGYRDAAARAPMRRDDIFRIASQSKAITALAVMILWEEGRFQLDDPVGKYLPEFAKSTVLKTFNAADSSYTAEPTTKQITVRQLLTHTSGLDYTAIGTPELKAVYAKAGVPSGIGTDKPALAEKMRLLATMPLRHQPGERMTYGLGFDVLGHLVEVLSGMPYDRFLRTRIFEPLGMRDTWFYLPADRHARLVTLHSAASGRAVPVQGPVFDGVNPDYPKLQGTYFSGGAGLSSTAEDYARFLQLFLNGGEFQGARLLSPKTVQLMLTEQMPKASADVGLGFGLETPDNDHQQPHSLGTFSWGGAYGSSYWADPKEQLIVQIYTNMYPPDWSLGSLFSVLTYSAMVQSRP